MLISAKARIKRERAEMKKLVNKFWKSEEGVTALEYGLIAGVIALAIAATISTLGTNLNSVFTKIQTTVASAAGTS
jgi:pilus assembly protein Flp/PilA